VQRDVGAHGRLGVHQFAAAPRAPRPISGAEARQLNEMIAVYTREMVGQTAILRLASSTPPWRTYWLSDDELRSLYVVTN
jgi:hypothetical protein